MKKELETRIEIISEVLDTNKAENIEVFDLAGKSYIADAVVIASSLGTRHTEALLDHMKRGLKPAETFLNTEISGDWIVVDLGDIVVHVMTPEYRNKYDMETFLSEIMSEKQE